MVENELRGKFAGNFVDFLSPYIGVFGLWVFLFIIASISSIMILDKSTQEIASIVITFFKSKLSKLKEKTIGSDTQSGEEISETINYEL